MNVEQILKFLVAGQAVFTLRSRRTHDHFTYRIMKKATPGRPDVFFASVLRGSDEWSYLGVFEPQPANLTGGRVRQTQGSRVGADAPSFLGLNWFLRNLRVNISEQVEFMHVGKCGRCGRALTNPESIESGLGPECANRVGGRPQPTIGPHNGPLQHLKPMPKGPRAVTPASVEKPLAGFPRAERPSEVRPSTQVLPPEHIENAKQLGLFADDCCKALDSALEQPREPNLVVPLLLSLLKEADARSK